MNARAKSHELSAAGGRGLLGCVGLVPDFRKGGHLLHPLPTVLFVAAVSVERRLYVTSLPPDAKSLSRHARGHWGVENRLHWRLDVVFGEDRCRARWGNAAVNLCLLRHLALNMYRGWRGADMGTARKMRRATLCREDRRRLVMEA